MELPNRELDLKEIVLPNEIKSKADNDEPVRNSPYAESVEPNLAKLLNEMVDPV
jgi:hypothetical protein